MITNFKLNADDLKRLTGASSKEHEVVYDATEEWRKFAEKQYGTIYSFSNLKEVITVEDSVKIKNALAAIRHILATLKDVQKFHSSNQWLSTSYDVAIHKVSELLKKSEMLGSILLSHLDG